MAQHDDTNWRAEMFDEFVFGPGDAVAVVPDVAGGHRLRRSRPVAGEVVNCRKENALLPVGYYLVTVRTGVRDGARESCKPDHAGIQRFMEVVVDTRDFSHHPFRIDDRSQSRRHHDVGDHDCGGIGFRFRTVNCLGTQVRV